MPSCMQADLLTARLTQRRGPQVLCVMCGRRPGGAVVIPKQNKDVCRECDRVVWQHSRSSVHFKWCKGCKRFLSLHRFGEKFDAAKCERCRQRGRQSYLAKKIKIGQAHGDEGVSGKQPRKSSLGSLASSQKARQAEPLPRDRSPPCQDACQRAPLPAPLQSGPGRSDLKSSKEVAGGGLASGSANVQTRRRGRSLSEGSGTRERPIVFKALPLPERQMKGAPEYRDSASVDGSTACGTGLGLPPEQWETLSTRRVDDERQFKALSHAFGAPLNAFCAVPNDVSRRQGRRPAKKRKRAMSCGNTVGEERLLEDEKKNLRARTNSVSELAVVAASMLDMDFSQGPRQGDHQLRSSMTDICPALYELASVHTRIIKLEEDAQRVPDLLERLSIQSADLLHWRSECERLEEELHTQRAEATELLSELRLLRDEISSLRTSHLGGRGSPSSLSEEFAGVGGTKLAGHPWGGGG